MTIFCHLDMNSYFATVEQQANPHLRGRPVGVCEHLGGIVIAPSIEAKRAGVKTAMPVWEACKICPDIILLQVDPPKYRSVSQRLWRLLSDYTPYVERASIDEAFLDVSSLIGLSEGNPWSTALLYALEIKQRIRREIGEWLMCSIGIAPNRLLAKIAANRDKPDGLTVIKPEDVDTLADQLRLTDIPGIGKRLQHRLSIMGILSINDLRAYDATALYERFGLLGYHLRAAAWFGGESPVRGMNAGNERETIKSMGHAYTLPTATFNLTIIRRLIFKLSEKVVRRLRRRDMSGSVASIFVRFSSKSAPQQWFHRSRKLHTFINDGRLLFRATYSLFESQSGTFPVRMIAISIAGLRQGSSSTSLFEQYRRQVRLVQAHDRVNDKYGEFTLQRAGMMHTEGLAGDTLGFGRIRELSF